jgi:repressor LexA
MTAKQKHALDYISSFWEEHGYSPSYDDIAKALNVSSRSNVHRIVYALIERGFIENLPGKARSLKVLKKSLATPVD